MNNNQEINQSKSSLIKGLVIGSLFSSLLFVSFIILSDVNTDGDSTDDANSGEPKPLYWVAPMDPNFRRDKPGKSPMGMDLVPVYEDSKQASIQGAVSIDPQVVQNLGVRRGKVESRVLEYGINTVGYVQYNEENLIHLHPRVSGWIETLAVNAAGDPVTKGQPVYTIYSPEIVNAQEELLIAMQRNNDSLVKAAEARLKALQLSDDIISKLKRTKQVMQTVTFYAPQSGVIDNLKIREGFFVQPGTTLMSVGNLDTVWVEAELFDRQAALVSQGDSVTLSLDYIPGKQWQGKVDYIYPTIDSTTRTVRLRVALANQDGQLKPNMFAQMQIKPTRQDSVLTIKREAVIRTGNQDRVVVELRPGEFKSVAVKLGRSNQQFFEVLDGLLEGDTVVTSAQFLIDSESSKTSDFNRMSSAESTLHDPMNHNMDHANSNHQSMTGEAHETTIPSARVNGVINAINKEMKTMNISRGPIAKWSRPATTMDFSVDSSIDITKWQAGDKILFTFEIRNDDFVVTEIALESDNFPELDPESNSSDRN
ncbi:MAG: efflux RND transporter periplasmic adaptor subunit [Gammaproteobacteria bacterium]|nr:efflux RND transporter periplasmic adaptor subunit [Gammaproteobacteria bacterium]